MIQLRNTMFLVLLTLAATTVRSRGASMEIWPAERRANNTFFCYGDDWNAMLISIYADDNGIQQLSLPDNLVEPTVLSLTLPQSVRFLGVHLQGETDAGVNPDVQSESVQTGEAPVQRLRIPLNNAILAQRIQANSYYYRVHVWFAAPKELDSRVSYELHHGEDRLAQGGSRLLTAGVVRAGGPMPQRFGFYPYGCFSTVPQDDYDRMADFYSRFGISGIEAHWSYGLPDEANRRYHEMFAANRRHGVRNNANLTLFARKHGGKIYSGAREPALAVGGLSPAMDAVCAALSTPEAREDWQQAHHHFDLAHWDWEPSGPDMWPGYDDPATIAAFAAAAGLADVPGPETLRTRHRDAYRRFRMQEIARPLKAMKQTLDAVRPIPFRAEQGSGASRHVDYDVYGSDVDVLSPMIYQPSPVGYARNLLETLRSSGVPAAKFWPDLTIGWPAAKVHRETPAAFLLDTMVTAAAGCGGVSHWPGIHLTDASWLGIHEGLKRIALVELFYLDGRPAAGVTLRGIPYRRETIDLGNRTIEQVAPDWRASLITFAHEYGQEVLLTLLNYNTEDDAFVAVAAPGLAGRYLVNPVAGTYHVLDDRGQAVLRVDAETPGLWIATADRLRLGGKTRVEAAAVADALEQARAAYLAANRRGALQLGHVGDIEVTFALTRFAGEEHTALQVTTPNQRLAFGAAGGRVYAWEAAGVDGFVATDNHGTDGFCMDMLWLPETARWSGDEVQEMTLAACENDGHEARIVYEAPLKRGFPGITLRKTYRIQAEGTTLAVQIEFQNERVDQEAARLAYWAHNVLPLSRSVLVTRDQVHDTAKGTTSIFTARALPDVLRPYVLMPEKVLGQVDGLYAEFLPELQNTGLVFRVPQALMSLYRWSARTRNQCGSEWMTEPFELPAGHGKRLDFSITVVPHTTPEQLQEQLLAANEQAVAEPENLLACTFADLDAAGLPSQYRIRRRGAHAEAAAVSSDSDAQGDTVVTLHMPEEATVFLDSGTRTDLDPTADYLFTVQVRVEDMRATGDWYRRPAGVRIYVYGLENAHTWLAIHGQGSTPGWVTAVLPFPAANTSRPQFAKANVLLRCYNMSGTVQFRNPQVARLPVGATLQRAFELEDGTRVVGGQLQLRP